MPRFDHADLTAFCRLDELGLVVTGQRLEPDRVVLACRVLDPDQWCRRCGTEGLARDTVVWRAVREPLGWRPTTLEVTTRSEFWDRVASPRLHALSHLVDILRRDVPSGTILVLCRGRRCFKLSVSHANLGVRP